MRAEGTGPLGRTLFRHVRRVAETASTNADVLAAAQRGAAEGMVLVADHQTAGRGRMGRAWVAPPGSSLLVSVLLRPPATLAGLVTMAAAVALRAAVAEVAGVDAALKWPNDLVTTGDGSDAGRKLAGILAEASWPPGSSVASGGDRLPDDEPVVVVVGAGVNVNWPEHLPDELIESGQSLDRCAGREVDRDALLVSYLAHLEALYRQLLADGGREVLRCWKEASATLGRRVMIDLGSSTFVGVAVDTTEDGRLIVQDADGRRRVFASGDVVHLRPSD